MRTILPALLIVVWLAVPAPAAAQVCPPGAFNQEDMAGDYWSFEHAMRLRIYPCVGSELLWSNDYGTHRAVYYSTERVSGGGFTGVVYQADPWVRSLDGRATIGVKPAEPGYIQIITIGPFVDHVRVYRLRKVE